MFYENFLLTSKTALLKDSKRGRREDRENRNRTTVTGREGWTVETGISAIQRERVGETKYCIHKH